MTDVTIRMDAQDASAAAAMARFNLSWATATALVKQFAAEGIKAGLPYEGLSSKADKIKEKFQVLGSTTQAEARKMEAGFIGVGKSVAGATVQASGLNSTIMTVGQTLLAASGFGSGLAAFYSVTQLIRSEWDTIRERQKTAADAQIDVNSAWWKASSMLVGRETTLTRESLYESIVENSPGGVPAVAAGFTAFAEAAGAGGDVPLETTLAMRNALVHFRKDLSTDAPAQAAILRGALLKQKLWGGDPAETVAETLQLMVADPAKDPLHTGEYTMPGIVNIANMFGGQRNDYREIAKDVTGFAQAMGDPKLRKSVTGLQRVSQQAKEIAVELGLVSADADYVTTREAVRASPEARNKLLGVWSSEFAKLPREEQLAVMQAVKSGRALQGSLTAESGPLIIGRMWMEGNALKDNLFMKSAAAAGEVLLPPTEAAAQVEAMRKGMQESPSAKAVETARTTATQKAKHDLGQTIIGASETARAALIESVREMGGGWLAQTDAGYMFDIQNSGSKTTEQVNELGKQMELRRAAKVLEFNRRVGISDESSKSQGALGVLEKYNAMIDQNGQIIELLKEANAQRANNVTAEKAATQNMVPKKTPVNNLNDPGRRRLPGNMR